MITGVVLRGLSAPFFDKVTDLRHRCWKDELPDLHLLDDGHDDHSLHFLMLKEEVVIAAARLCIHELLYDVPDPHLYVRGNSLFPAPFGCMNRLVVHPAYRRIGLSLIHI